MLEQALIGWTDPARLSCRICLYLFLPVRLLFACPIRTHLLFLVQPAFPLVLKAHDFYPVLISPEFFSQTHIYATEPAPYQHMDRL